MQSRLFKVKVHDLDLDKTFSCGQCFRWTKYNDVWIGVISQLVIAAKITDSTLNLYAESYSEYTNWTEVERELYAYFDLNLDYSALFDLSQMNMYEKRCIETASGIHILNQDKFEICISFIISQNNNIPRITKLINALAVACGTKLNHGLYTFPTDEQLQTLSIAELMSLNLGYRAEYIYSFARKYKDYKGILNTSSNSALYSQLISILGIGPKVANCIALFGYHNLSAFPVDRWIKRILIREYSGNFPLGKFGDYAGVFQQYMFYTEKA